VIISILNYIKDPQCEYFVVTRAYHSATHYKLRDYQPRKTRPNTAWL